MRAVDVLVKARKLLLRFGWTQKYYTSKEGAFCALGAINMAASGCPLAGRPAARTAVRYLGGVVGGHVPAWNDRSERLKGEVILAFDQAIKNAKRRHPKGD